MSTKILVDSSRVRFDFAEARKYLQEKYQNQLRVTHNGGMWTITLELLAFLRSSPNEKEIILDDYNNPSIVNVAEMLELATATYNGVMVKWHEEHTELSKKR